MSAQMGAGPSPAGPRALLSVLRETMERHRILRFLVVGGVNTAFGYSLFLIALAVMPTTFSALVLATVAGILFNFQTTGRYVFRTRAPGKIVLFFAVYGIVFLYNAAGLAALEGAGVAAWLAGIVLLPGAVTISYILNRDLVFRSVA